MIRKRLWNWWLTWGIVAQAVAFVAVFYFLMVRKHDAFHTFALDLGKFDQAIWNTLHGRFLYSTLQDRSILANHFSPFMALLSPVFLIWPNVRALFFLHTLGLGVAGWFLYKIVQSKHPAMAPWFSLAYFLNPALHEVTLTEVRRVTFAVPFLALAAYALYARKRGWMCAGLAIALLCKENIAVIVFMVGVYLVLFEHDWRWGVPVMAVGVAWALVVTFWVIAAFRSQTGDISVYPQMNYFGLSGDSYAEILANLVRDPAAPFRGMFDRAGLLALLRVFLPVGLVLPFCAPDWALMVLPSLAYMLMSSARGMHRLEDWYMASVLPGIFAAIAVFLGRQPERRARRLLVGLVGTAVAGYLLYSYAPLGGHYEPTTYQVTDHHRLASEVVRAMPDAVRVAAQDPYVPHLSHREHIYLYPWISIGEENVEYLILDRKLNPYPLQPPGMHEAIDNMIADTSMVIEMEGDGIFVFHRGGQALPSWTVDRAAEGTMLLERVEVAVRDDRGFYCPAIQRPITVGREGTVRVSLYWRALDAPGAERTVSVRVAPMHEGQPITEPLIAVHDSLPGAGKKPTSWWQEGWEIRDVHYLDIPTGARLGTASLELLLYDSTSRESVLFDGGQETLRLSGINVVE